jgi:hypothetical protein
MTAITVLNAFIIPDLFNLVVDYTSDPEDFDRIIGGVATCYDPLMAYVTACRLFGLRALGAHETAIKLAQTGLFCETLFDHLGVAIHSNDDVELLVVPYVRANNLRAIKFLMTSNYFLVPTAIACFRYNALSVLGYVLTNLYKIDAFAKWGMLHLTMQCADISFEALAIAHHVGAVNLDDVKLMQDDLNDRCGKNISTRRQAYIRFLQEYGSDF